MTDISIAMATYNGARYIRAQLDSIANQTQPPIELVVSDDGSTDETLVIVREFARSAPFPVHIHANPSRLGFADNFLSCAARCEGDWIAFCDQDDVWMPGKLAAFDRAIRNGPVNLKLVYHTAELVDHDLNSIGRRLPHVPRDETVPALRKPGFWFVGGCVICFRRNLIAGRDLRDRPRDNYLAPSDSGGRALVPHDKWVCVLANASGSIVALSEVLILYRRHVATETAFDDQSFLRERIAKSVATGVEYYRFLSERAEEFGEALETDATAVPAHGTAKFTCLSRAFALRSLLYGERRFSARLKVLRGLIRTHAYWGDPFIAWGIKSLIKDFIFVIIGPQVVLMFRGTCG